jgi:hypothetical protein
MMNVPAGYNLRGGPRLLNLDLTEVNSVVERKLPGLQGERAGVYETKSARMYSWTLFGPL